MSAAQNFKIGDWVMQAAFTADLIKLDEIKIEKGKPAYYGKKVYSIPLGILDDHGIRLLCTQDNRMRVYDPVPADGYLLSRYICELENAKINLTVNRDTYASAVEIVVEWNQKQEADLKASGLDYKFDYYRMRTEHADMISMLKNIKKWGH